MDTDSYDSGDWFSRLIGSGENNNWAFGLQSQLKITINILLRNLFFAKLP